ncbi:MAG: Rrf2 family transcriptional regulator [bacterium]|nr:Rrf2 family transcriptional regulator [bacterium]
MHIYSKAVENAVCILTRLAQQDSGTVHTVQKISQMTSLSSPTVAKTLQQLAKAGLLVSRKGPGGGFFLNQSPSDVTLKAIVASIEGAEPFSQCLAGLASCSEENVCPLHDKWESTKKSLVRFLETTTLNDMVCALVQKGFDVDALDKKKIESETQ